MPKCQGGKMKDIQKRKSKTNISQSSKEFGRDSKSETGVCKGLYLHRLPQCCSWQQRRSDRWRWLILACQQHRQEDQLAGFLTGTIWLPLPLWLHPGNQWSMWLLRRSSYWKKKKKKKRDRGFFLEFFQKMGMVFEQIIRVKLTNRNLHIGFANLK